MSERSVLTNALYKEFVRGHLDIFKHGDSPYSALVVRPWGLRWDLTPDKWFDSWERADRHFAPRYRFSFWRREAREIRNHWRRFVMAIKGVRA